MQNEIHRRIAEHVEQRVFKGLSVPIPRTNHYLKLLKARQRGLQVPNLQRIVDSDDPTHKTILVSELFSMEDVQGEPDAHDTQITYKAMELTVKNFTTQEIFNFFTKEDPDEARRGQIPYPNSFETVGHMAHYNLTSEQIPYKEVIGEITLVKCPNIRTVVNKTEKLHNIYRTPTLEHMAGEVDYKATVKEVGTLFSLDFEKVYWCSRLQQERDRLLGLMHSGELLADIFCGVGPLAVRSAKRGLHVIANDLNPHCHQYLLQNSRINKVADRLLCWNMCAREAIRKIYRLRAVYMTGAKTDGGEFTEEELSWGKRVGQIGHIYMNLPVDAIQFLDVLRDYGQQMQTEQMPLVHVNCFVVADSTEKSLALLQTRIRKILPLFRQEDIVCAHHIKNVTVIMRMYCLSFRLRKLEQQEEIIAKEDEQQEEIIAKEDEQQEEIIAKEDEQREEEEIVGEGKPRKKVKTE